MEKQVGKQLNVGIACYPTYGGSGVIATEVGMEMARRGHRIHVMSYDLPRRLDRFMENIFFHEVEVLAYPLFEYPPYCLALASAMARVCEQESLDIIHAHYAIPHAVSAYLAREILHPKAPKIITTLHGTDITLVGNDPSYAPISKLSIERSDGVTAVSNFLKRATYEQLNISQDVSIEVIPNFVDLNDFGICQERAGEIRAKLCSRLAKGNEKLLCHVSNFRPLKRIQDVVRVFAKVRSDVAARLVLVGDGPERASIERLVDELNITDDVLFLGKQSSVAEVLACSDIFFLPSETESFGLSALEAMACAVPVIATRVGGLPEVVKDGVTGFLFPVGDIDAMAAKAKELLLNPTLAKKIGQAGRDEVIGKYQIGRVVDYYEKFYFRVLEGEEKS